MDKMQAVRPGWSLGTRISVAVAVLIAVLGGAAGFAIYDNVERALRSEQDARLEANLTWLQTSLETDEALLEFEPKTTAPYDGPWEIKLKHGTVLWSKGDRHTGGFDFQARDFTIGDDEQPLETRHTLRLADKVTEGGYVVYKVRSKRAQVELQLIAGAPRMSSELNRLAIALWTVGPLTILIAALVLSLFIRRQLAPLTRIAQEASKIGPESARTRIEDAGTTAEYVALREALNKMVSRLAEGLDRERQFASMAAHEFRTPLAQMRTSIEVTLRKERVAEEYREALEHSLLDVERLQKLVDGLLLLVRGQNSGAVASKVALERPLAEAVRESGVAAQLAALPPVEVRGSTDLLGAAFRNVLENAARHAPPAPPSVQCELMNGTARVSVIDTGPGVPEADRERIFQPLVRLDKARSIGAHADGFGLGLAIARAAVRACGGELSCCARADGAPGAAFVFDLRVESKPHLEEKS